MTSITYSLSLQEKTEFSQALLLAGLQKRNIVSLDREERNMISDIMKKIGKSNAVEVLTSGDEFRSLVAKLSAGPATTLPKSKFIKISNRILNFCGFRKSSQSLLSEIKENLPVLTTKANNNAFDFDNRRNERVTALQSEIQDLEFNIVINNRHEDCNPYVELPKERLSELSEKSVKLTKELERIKQFKFEKSTFHFKMLDRVFVIRTDRLAHQLRFIFKTLVSQ